MASNNDDAEIARLQARVDQLTAESEIRGLIGSLSWNGDAGNLEEYIQLFAPNATFEIEGRSRQNNAAEIREAAAARMKASAPGQSRHVVTGTTIQVNGGEARARSYFAVVGKGDGRPEVRSTGTYEDSFVRTEAGWKYQSRYVRVDAYPKLS